jgi:hypothetical protein
MEKTSTATDEIATRRKINVKKPEETLISSGFFREASRLLRLEANALP